SVYERPDFYILSSADWRETLERKVAALKAKKPEKRITIDAQNVAVFEDEINKHGKPYRGIGIAPSDLAPFREQWSKIVEAFSVAS
ncbi:MAG: hypothetical protein D6741_07395, partial [Planctomycetota bacterium]